MNTISVKNQDQGQEILSDPRKNPAHFCSISNTPYLSSKLNVNEWK